MKKSVKIIVPRAGKDVKAYFQLSGKVFVHLFQKVADSQGRALSRPLQRATRALPLTRELLKKFDQNFSTFYKMKISARQGGNLPSLATSH
jgi:hypothetical protein